jgi:hypothetical protein
MAEHQRRVTYFPTAYPYILQRYDSLCWAAVAVSINEAFHRQESGYSTDPEAVTRSLVQDVTGYSFDDPDKSNHGIKTLATALHAVGGNYHHTTPIVPSADGTQQATDQPAKTIEECRNLLLDQIDLKRPVGARIEYDVEGLKHFVTVIGYAYIDDLSEIPADEADSWGSTENPMLTICDPFQGMLHMKLSTLRMHYKAVGCYDLDPAAEHLFNRAACMQQHDAAVETAALEGRATLSDPWQSYSGGEWVYAYLTRQKDAQ